MSAVKICISKVLKQQDFRAQKWHGVLYCTRWHSWHIGHVSVFQNITFSVQIGVKSLQVSQLSLLLLRGLNPE